MAYSLPSEDFMFPNMVEEKHMHPNGCVWDRGTGEVFPGVVVAMSEGKWIVERCYDGDALFVLHEGNWAFAHGRPSPNR